MAKKGAFGSTLPTVMQEDPADDELGMVVRVVGGTGPTPSDTATSTRVAVGSGAPVDLLVANPDRNGPYEVQADFANTDAVYVKEGAAASATNWTATLQPGGVHTCAVNYTGVVTAISASGSQNVNVTEYEDT